MIARLIYKSNGASFGMFFLNYLLFAIGGILFGLSILYLQYLFDDALCFRWKSSFHSLYAVITILFVFRILEAVIEYLGDRLWCNHRCRVWDAMAFGIDQELSAMKLNGRHYSMQMQGVIRAYQGLWHALDCIHTLIGSGIYYIAYMFVIGLYLFRIDPFLVFLLVLDLLTMIYVLHEKIKLFRKWEKNRKSVINYSYHQNYIKKARSFGSRSYFMQLFRLTLNLEKHFHGKSDIKMIILRICGKLVSLLGYSGIFWIIFSMLMHREITIGMFVVIIISVDHIFGLTERIINEYLNELIREYMMVKDDLGFFFEDDKKSNQEAYQNELDSGYI
jgi:ATP-binding cassette subfamily B protein